MEFLDPEAIAAAIEKAKSSDKPTMIACKTTIGYGAPNKAELDRLWNDYAKPPVVKVVEQ